ncbi:MAG: hypothetical protein OXH31_00240 [Gammaproteobacteria bacterium]|nr:hypothetical protein [Gammaproteobacteria bacterium]
MKRSTTTLLFIFTLCLMAGGVNAERFKDVYISTNVGFNTTSSFGYLGSSTDQGSVCDPIINPSEESRRLAGCPTAGTGWLTNFDNGSGIAGTVILGRHINGSGMLKNWSLEIEFSYGESVLDQTQSISSRSGVARDKLSNEIYRAQEHIGTITSNSVFANLRYNLRSGHKTQPYLGFGFGLVNTSIYGGRIWVRNNDWTQISTGSGLPNSEEVRRNLAGTTSSVHETLSDSAPTIQVFTGVDWKFNDSTLIGLRGKFTQFDSFEATGTLDVLRSHSIPEGYASKREIGTLRFFHVGLTITWLLE